MEVRTVGILDMECGISLKGVELESRDSLGQFLVLLSALSLPLSLALLSLDSTPVTVPRVEPGRHLVQGWL